MTLESRIAKLEKQNRRFKRGGMLATIFLSSLFLMGTHESAPPSSGTPPPSGSSSQRHIRANRITITDDTGKTRATMLTFKDKLPGLFMHDDAGRVRITLSMTKNGTTFLSFLDQNKKTRLIMGLSNSGQPKIKFLNASGQTTRTLE